MTLAAQRPDDRSGPGAAPVDVTHDLPGARSADRSQDRSRDLPADPTKDLSVLSQRADFLRASRARRQATTGFHLQARRREPGEAEGVRVGFTCSKKVGNAVARNRAKRRLREIARAILPVEGKPGWDYVLVGRAGVTADHPFETLKSDLAEALRRIHAPRKAR